VASKDDRRCTWKAERKREFQQVFSLEFASILEKFIYESKNSKGFGIP
jgi:hypothetical protein